MTRLPERGSRLFSIRAFARHLSTIRAGIAPSSRRLWVIDGYGEFIVRDANGQALAYVHQPAHAGRPGSGSLAMQGNLRSAPDLIMPFKVADPRLCSRYRTYRPVYRSGVGF
jgi:hypothetical protein